MKKFIWLTFSGIALATAIFTTHSNSEKLSLSDATLANIEALTAGEIPIDKC